jgi:iron complex outermembrane receptor protein
MTPSRTLLSGTALLALFTAPAWAQIAATDVPEQVVVTGTSIRGVAPTGTNLINLSAADIEASGATTVQGALANTPVISGFGNAGEGSRIHNNYYQPSIHNLGASGSNATLILVDGHQFPTGGTNHTTADPNVIPANMLQRIDVIANGDSSIYGSNAVAGVINFVTRTRFDGLQLNAQADYLQGTSNATAGLLWGTNWDHGNAVLGYQYVEEGQLTAAQRSFSSNTDQTARAISAGLPVGLTNGSSTNFNTFNGAGPGCAQPLARLNGAGNYYNLVTGQQYAATQSNATCNLSNENTLIEHEVRNNVMARIRQDFGDRLTTGFDILYAQRQDHGVSGAGSVSNVTAFGTGAQANPFFAVPPGYAGPAVTRETVYANLDPILGGRGTYNTDGATTMFADVSAEYRLFGDFVVNGLAVAGRDDSYQRGQGTANASSVDLALNGTANNAGNTTTPAVANSTIIPLNLPLTTANALDVWHTGAANGTSANVVSRIEDNRTLTENVAGFEQFRLSTNGTLFDVPAGPLKVATGVESVHYTLTQTGISSNNTGPTSSGANNQYYAFQRTVRSAFGEIDAPVISPEMGIPLVSRLQLNASGRYDHYSDVGDTLNYKLAFNWEVIEGLRLRGNMSTSFVAPGLDQIGDNNHAFIGTNVGATTALNGIPIPVASYPILTQFAPSQFANGQACTLASVTCVLASTVQGVNIHGGAANGHPAQGHGWEIGADLSPNFLPGLLVQATFWHTNYLGAFTTPSAANVVNNVGLNGLAEFYPGAGASAASIYARSTGLVQSTPFPSTINVVLNTDVGNWLYLYAEGIDASFTYSFDTDWGGFHFGDNITQLVKYDTGLGQGGIPYSILNTTGSSASFPSTSTQTRANIGWSNGPYSLDLFANYTGPYRNWSGTSVTPITQNAQGNPSGGGDPVKANLTFDLHASYDFKTEWLGSDRIGLTIINIVDTDPPFYLGSTGYDNWVGSPLGRVIKLSFSAAL